MNSDARIEQQLPGFYRELHAKRAFLGDTWRVRLPLYRAFLEDHGGPMPRGVLDFGCGPSGGLAAAGPEVLGGRICIPYDPHVAAYAADPWDKPFDAFFSCDVFEHLTQTRLFELLSRIKKKPGLRTAFISLSTRHANKTLPNGMNAHLTVRSVDWWRGVFDVTFGNHFDCPLCVVFPEEGSAVFGFVRKP